MTLMNNQQDYSYKAVRSAEYPYIAITSRSTILFEELETLIIS